MATTCDQIREMLSAYLDGDLDPRQQEEIDGHRAACPACDRELTLFRQVQACMRADEDPVPSPRATELFYARLAGRSAKRTIWARIFSGGWQRVSLATGLAALLLLGVWVYKDSHPDVERREVRIQTGNTVGKNDQHVRITGRVASRRKPIRRIARVTDKTPHQALCRMPINRYHRQNTPLPGTPAPPRLDNQSAPAIPDMTIAAIAGLTETAEAPECLPPSGPPPGNGKLVCVADAPASFATPESAVIAMMAETAE